MIYNTGWANLKPQQLKYTPALAAQAAKLLQAGQSLTATARSLNISRASLRNWRDRDPALNRNGLAEHLLGEGLLGFCPKRLCGFGAVYMLKTNLMLLLVVQYGDGIAVSDTNHFARELEGRCSEC